MSEPTVLVAALADRPYWPSLLEVLGPPRGCSFYRPYNYRRAWLAPSLDELLSNSILRCDAVVGMRFGRDSYATDEPIHRRFIPLRTAEVQVQRDDTHVNVHVRLHGYVPLDPGSHRLWALEIEEVNRFNPEGDPILAWQATPGELGQIDKWKRAAKNVPPGALWESLCSSDLLSEAARDHFKDRVVAFAGGVRDLRAGCAMDPTVIYRNDLGIETYGYSLQVDRPYEVDFETRRITPPGQKKFAAAPDFEFMTSTEVIQALTGVVPFTGNYRQMPVPIRPRQTSRGRADLHWSPRFAFDVSSRDLRGDVGIRLPFTVRRSWPLALILLAFLFVLFGAFAVTLGVNANDLSAAGRSAMQAIGIALISAGIAFGTKVVDDIRRQG
jgi:hypothetical protein